MATSPGPMFWQVSMLLSFLRPALCFRPTGILTVADTTKAASAVHTPITSTPARHGPAGIEHISGDVTGFIVATKEMQIYLTGDTVFYDGIKEVAEKFRPKYVFIFAGAAKPRGPFNVTMSTNDAIDTAFGFPAATIIPVHFEGWSH